jgi:hypothetical protein
MDTTRVGIARHVETGDLDVVITSEVNGETILKTYLSPTDAHAFAADVVEVCNDIDTRLAAATRAAVQAIATMREDTQ